MRQLIPIIPIAFSVSVLLTPQLSAIADERVVEFTSPQANEQQLWSRSAHYRAWKIRGDEAMQAHNYDRAIALYDQAINLNQGKPSAWERRGDALVKQGEYQAAIEAYNEAMNYSSEQKAQLQKKIEATREKLAQRFSD